VRAGVRRILGRRRRRGEWMRNKVGNVSGTRQVPGRDWNGIENIPDAYAEVCEVFGWYVIDQT
jgi:hypothetical protein